MSKVSGLFQDLTTIKKARNGRLASWDQRGKNQDYWEIPAKESIVLGEVEGPGCITHIWMTSSCRKVKAPSILDPVLNASAAPVMEIHPALGVIWDDYDPFYYRKALIKITWDNQDTPSVLAPLGDFFCIGNCYPGNFSSLPFNVSLKPEEAGRYGAPCSVSCYFPMPFNKKAKIEIINENELPFILYFNIDYEMYKESLDENTAYFHSCWRRENPCDGWGPDVQTNSPEVNNVRGAGGARVMICFSLMERNIRALTELERRIILITHGECRGMLIRFSERLFMKAIPMVFRCLTVFILQIRCVLRRVSG